VSKVPYLSNVIAAIDITDIQNDIEAAAPRLIFSLDQLSGANECVVVQHSALNYAANANIEDTNLFADALVGSSVNGEEVFFEANYEEFTSAFPFKAAPDVLRIGVIVVCSHEGFRFQTVTLVDDQSVRHDPYYMFLPIEAVEAAREFHVSEEFSHHLFSSMEVEFPGARPTPGSKMEDMLTNTIPVSATLATITLSFLAMKSEMESEMQTSLPIIQNIEGLPQIVSFDIGANINF
jgi:hypothetical protein